VQSKTYFYVRKNESFQCFLLKIKTDFFYHISSCPDANAKDSVNLLKIKVLSLLIRIISTNFAAIGLKSFSHKLYGAF